MVFILLLPVHARHGLVLQSSLGRAEMENHGFGHQADLIIREPYTATFSLTLHSPKKADTAIRPEADARPKIAPKSQKTN